MRTMSASSGSSFERGLPQPRTNTSSGFRLPGVSASLDGTVRAFDLMRYRNFRTLTSPEPAQFISLAVDPSGEVVCAGECAFYFTRLFFIFGSSRRVFLFFARRRHHRGKG